MKKNFLSTVILALLLLCGGVVKGQNDSLPDIRIGSIVISESNDSIIGDGISGHVSYDAETKTLILDNASIAESVSLWWRHIRIQLTGNNYLQHLMIVSDSCTIVGPGSLFVGSSSQETAIEAPRTAYIALKQQAMLNVIAANTGIDCMYDDIGEGIHIYPLFDIDNSSLKITAPTCFFLISFWRLNDCHIVSPSDIIYDSNNHWITQSGNIVLSVDHYFEIMPGDVGIQNVNQNGWQSFGMSNGICLKGVTGNQTIEVMNLAGQSVFVGRAKDSDIFIPLGKGAYIVRVGRLSRKTIVN